MLNTQLVANFLEEQLNLYGAELPYKLTFGLSAELKDESRNSFIQGIVRTVDAPAEPVKNYIDMKYVLNVDLLVPAARSNKFIIQVNEIVGKIIKAYNDTRQDFGNGYGIITFSAPHPLKYDINYGKGDSVPLSFTVRVTFTETSTVTSSTKHWIFEGIEIPFISESVTVETEGVTRKIYSEQYNKTLKTGQQRFYNFTVPYTSRIGILFQKIILNSSISENSTYELTYYDEDAFPQGEPFKTTVILYRSGRSGSAKPDASAFDITFTDADGLSAADYPQYYLGLLDFPFDNQSEDTRYFNSRSEQSAYFEGKIETWGKFKRIAAPNLNSIDITRQIYPNDGTYPLFDLAKKNYAVIKTISGESAAPQYFYYFITGCEIGAGGQISYDLHLDTVQTYFFDPSVSFADCLIERAHLNRFEEVEGQPDYVKFVTDPATKIYNAEDALNYPKRLTKRTKLGLRPTGIQEVDDWLNENVDYWVYVYCDPSHEFTVQKPYLNEKGTTKLFPAKLIDDAISPPAVFYYPVYKINSTNQVFVESNFTGEITGNVKFPVSKFGKSLFEDNQPAGGGEMVSPTPFYYSVKISYMPPFVGNGEQQEIFNNIYVDNSNQLVINMDITLTADSKNNGFLQSNCCNAIYTQSDDRKIGLLTGIFQPGEYTPTENYFLPYNDNILISDIKTATGTDRFTFNPKLNSQNFRELIITASSGDTFAYDIQKLQSDNISFLYTEPFQPDVTKYYMRVNAPCGLYDEGTESNYTGLVGSTDNSLAVANDQYAAFIANNKNFWLQSNMKITTGVAKSFFNAYNSVGSSVANGAVRGGATGAAAGAVTGAISAVNTLTNTAIDTTIAVIDRNMTIDNLRSAPDQLKNANGNILFNMLVTDLGLYVEEFTALDGDLKSAFDFMELFGFSVNAVGNVKDYANIRKFHNYIKAQVQAISGALSNTSRADLRQRFANGIRFWNQDTPDYSQENYENWLDEE